MKDQQTQFNSFQAGEIDMADIPGPEQYKTAEANFPKDVVFRDEAGTSSLYINNEAKYTSNLNLRKAVQASINVDVLASDIMGSGTKSVQSYIPGSLTEGSYGINFADINGPLMAFDPVVGKEFLASAITELGLSSASEISLEFLIAAGDTNKAIAEYIQSQLATNLGITVTIKQLDQQAYSQARNDGYFDLVYGG